MPPPEQLNFITGNKNKLAEVKHILGDVVPLQSQSLDLTEIQGTIEEISMDKSQRAAAIVRFPNIILLLLTATLFFHVCYSLLKIGKVAGPVLTEDTCLCFNALKDLPGPYMYVSYNTCTMIRKFNEAFSHSKWFLQALGHEGLNNLLVAYEDKSAQAVCTFAYCSGPGQVPIIFQGRVNVRCRLH